MAFDGSMQDHSSSAVTKGIQLVEEAGKKALETLRDTLHTSADSVKHVAHKATTAAAAGAAVAGTALGAVTLMDINPNRSESEEKAEMRSDYKAAQNEWRQHEKEDYRAGALNLDRVEAMYHPAPACELALSPPIVSRPDIEQHYTNATYEHSSSLTAASYETYGGPPMPADASYMGSAFEIPEQQQLMASGEFTFGGPPVPATSVPYPTQTSTRMAWETTAIPHKEAYDVLEDRALAAAGEGPSLENIQLKIGPSREALHRIVPRSPGSHKQTSDAILENEENNARESPAQQSLAVVAENANIPKISPGAALPDIRHAASNAVHRLQPLVSNSPIGRAVAPTPTTVAVRSKL